MVNRKGRCFECKEVLSGEELRDVDGLLYCKGCLGPDADP